MKKIHFICDEIFLRHVSRYSHPERPERISAILNAVNSSDIAGSIIMTLPEKAERNDILRVHSTDHFEMVQSTEGNSYTQLDPDTYANEDSFEVAMFASGAVIKAVKILSKGEYDAAFCCVRPPGHHAERDTPMGFCLFDNIAVGAAWYTEHYPGKRAAIIDFDVHHGNGTQDIFYSRNDVLFISLHQDPLYPYKGKKHETGYGEGKGFTINFPLPAGTTGEKYRGIFESEIIPALKEFSPSMLFISAGFDAHKSDPLANMALESNDYFELTKILKEYAVQAGIPVVSVLEGGYNLSALSESVIAHIKGLLR